MTQHRQTATLLPIGQLLAHPGNVRRDLGPDEELEALARTVVEHGLIEPLIVTQHHQRADRYIVLAGHRRLAACTLAVITEVPCVVRHHVEDRDQIVLMLVDDIHHRPLDPIERAEAYGALRHQGLSQRAIAREVGTDAANVSRSLALLDLDEEEREEVRQGRLGAYEAIAHARAARQAAREAGGRALMGRPADRRGIHRSTWFSADHRLSEAVAGLCTHHERPAVGEVGCGPCWEQALRDEPAEEFAAAQQEAESFELEQADPVVVERILAGDYRLPSSRAERILVVERWLRSGRSLKDLDGLTGWRSHRYVFTARARLRSVS